MRPNFEWRLRSGWLTLGERTLVMGVVNVTPDSFSDGGQFLDPARAVGRALKLLEEGADILDIGGESTRPGRTSEVSAGVEMRRILPVIDGILKQAPAAVISVDTYKSQTAEAALAAGAEIINDVSGFTWDEKMVEFLAGCQCGCVLMHTRGRPEQWPTLPSLAADEVVPLVLGGLRELSERAVCSGIARERLVLDPGFGFGKRLDENLPLLARLSDLRQLGFPILSGTSRKSFVTRSAGLKAGDPESVRLAGSIAAMTLSIVSGAHIVRVHDVKESVAAARVASALLEADRSDGKQAPREAKLTPAK